MILNNRELNRVCCFYAGESHFFSTALVYLINKVRKGSKVLLFIEENTREKLSKVIPSIAPNTKYENWQKNVVMYPLKSISGITEESHFLQHIKNMIELIALDCSEEGLIICMQDANCLTENTIKRLEELIPNVPVTIHIVACYRFTADKEFMREVLSQYKYLLNTNGLNEIGKVYPKININYDCKHMNFYI